jgi:hypothetical protein
VDVDPPVRVVTPEQLSHAVAEAARGEAHDAVAAGSGVAGDSRDRAWEDLDPPSLSSAAECSADRFFERLGGSFGGHSPMVQFASVPNQDA